MDNIKYNWRYLARVVIEAVTPLAICSGEKDIISDALVTLDVNGLPYIPGTSLAGVLRHNIGENDAKRYFGMQEGKSEQSRYGSNIIFTEARMLGSDGNVVDGLATIDFENNDFYRHYADLPVRQHVRINHHGVSSKGGKFDNQVVFKGTRFCFEIELLSEEGNAKQDFEEIIKNLKSGLLRLGSNTRSGLGEVKVCSLQKACIDLTDKGNLLSYISKSSSLNNQNWPGWKSQDTKQEGAIEDFISYQLELRADDFYLFGSGFGDDDADMIPVKSNYVEWTGDKPGFKEDMILIPGSSVKGAVAHRTGYYFNKLNKFYADGKSEEEIKKLTCENCLAVKELFGSAGNASGEGQKAGNVFISDVILNHSGNSKLLNHVAIDRFTGGTIDGALFSERVVFDQDCYKLVFLVSNRNYSKYVIESFENALTDICKGLLPLGGGVNRGNGSFNGILLKNKSVIYDGR